MAKSSNVMAGIEPEIKEQAEGILAQLGLPVSVVINVLCRQTPHTEGAARRSRCRKADDPEKSEFLRSEKRRIPYTWGAPLVFVIM